MPDKETVYSNINIKDIKDVDYRHAIRVFKELKMKDLGDYYDLYDQIDTLLLADE